MTKKRFMGESRGGRALSWTLLVVIGLVVVSQWDFWFGGYGAYVTKAKVHEGESSSKLARSTLGIACSEGALRKGMTHKELKLKPPSAYAGTYTHSVTAEVVTKNAVRVTIIMKEIGKKVRSGDTVVWEGTCMADGIIWKVGGTVPQIYLPRV